MKPLPALKRFLRSPRVIVGEIAVIALLCAVGAAVPQVGMAGDASLAGRMEGNEAWQALVRACGFDHIFRGVWFLAATTVASLSLFLVILEQVRRLSGLWRQRLAPANFQSAPWRVEFERPAALSRMAPVTRIWAERRLGLAGSPVFHVGLLLVIVAGVLRALFGADAAVDLVEGETLPPLATAWAAQWPGVLGRPVRLDVPVTLKAVMAARYTGGDLRDLKTRLIVHGAAGDAESDIAVNHDLRVAGERLFLGADFGPTALLEWQGRGPEPVRQATMLAERGAGSYEGESHGPNGMCAYLRASVDAAGEHPSLVEVRVMRGSALLFAGNARVGQAVSLPDGGKLVLRGTPFWARLRGSHDSALWLAYLGFALVMGGATLMFTVVKLDFCVTITPLGERERVFVALKPQRFAPLFQERFDRLVRDLAASDAKPAARAAITLEPPAARRWATSTPVVAMLLAMSVLTGCNRTSVSDARKLVERYNQVVVEAYRRGDVKLIDPVVGPNEGKKLTGLIGVRLDLGLTLDSEMLSLDVLGVEKDGDALRVQTKEQWRYRDRKIGTGEQVGEESTDSYEMLYVFKKIERAWMVDEIKFTSAPQVGRKTPTWIADRAQLHGRPGLTNLVEAKQP